MGSFGTCLRRTALVLTPACVFLSAWLAGAQEVSPEVQTLYNQARQAQAADHALQAVAEYQHILQLAPDLAPAYNNLGRLLYNLGRYPEAVTVLTKGLTLQPSMFPAQVMLGASYYELGQYANALKPLQEGAEGMPTDRFASITLARTLIALHRPQEALKPLNAILATDPKDQEAWYLVGKLDLALSRQAFAEVQSINGSSPLAHQLEGEIMESMGNTSGAVAAYKQALEAAPKDPQALLHLADAYWHTGDWAKARLGYLDLLSEQPGNCSAHWKLANSMDELGEEPDHAIAELNVALKQCPDLPQAYAERGRALLRSGKAADAVADLKLAAAAAPDEPSVQQLLARAYRSLGDKTSADAADARFLALQKALHEAQEHHASAVLQANQ